MDDKRRQNLVPFSEMTPEKAFEIRSRGGKQCGLMRRFRKQLRMLLARSYDDYGYKRAKEWALSELKKIDEAPSA